MCEGFQVKVPQVITSEYRWPRIVSGSHSSTTQPRPADEKGPSQIPGRAEALGTLNGKTPFTISKQTYSQLNCAAWMVPIPPAESDFSSTFFF